MQTALNRLQAAGLSDVQIYTNFLTIKNTTKKLKYRNISLILRCKTNTVRPSDVNLSVLHP